MSGRRRVLQILGPIRLSGMEQMLLSVRHQAAANGLDLFFLSMGGTESMEYQAMVSAGIPGQIAPELGWDVGSCHALLKAVRKSRPDIIHLHREHQYLLTVVLLRLVSPRAVIVRTVHNCFASEGRKGTRRWAQALLADRLVNRLTGPSPAVVTNEAKLGRHVSLVFNWVGPEYISADLSPRSEPAIVLVGNCSGVKNHTAVLRAALDANVKVVHIGDESGICAAETAMLTELSNRNMLLGRGAHHPLPYFRSTDLFAMPSVYEGFGVALMEAIAVGLPCLVSDIDGFQWARPFDHVCFAPTGDFRAPIDGYIGSWPSSISRSSGALLFSVERGISDLLELYGQKLLSSTGEEAVVRPASQIVPTVARLADRAVTAARRKLTKEAGL